MYHRFSKEAHEGSTSAEELDIQLEYIKREYSVVSLSEIAGIYNNGRKMPSDLVAVTVDDGYSDFCEVAFPVFSKHKVPVTAFVCTAFIDGTDWIWTDKIKYIISRTDKERIRLPCRHEHVRVSAPDEPHSGMALSDCFECLYNLDPRTLNLRIQAFAGETGVKVPETAPEEYRPMTWDQIRKLVSRNVEIGAHGVSHYILPNLSGDQIWAEVIGSRERIEEELGTSPVFFCYPNGNTNPDVSKIVENAGFTCAVVTEYGFNDENSDRYALKRIGVGNLPFIYYVKSLSGFDLMMNLIREKTLLFGR